MKIASSVLALAILAVVLPAQAQSHKEGAAPVVPANAVTDPLKPIYKIPGVRDSGGATNIGVATSFICTNFGNVEEKVKFTAIVSGGTVSKIGSIPPRQTFTASTHFTALFSESFALTPGTVISQSSVIISATSLTNIFCTAMIIDAASTSPNGIALHMVRFNPAPGTQE